MSRSECVREAEVVAAAVGQQWPEGCDAELRAHAEACEVCRDVLVVAAALHQDRAALREIDVPAAGQVWWRSAVRARAEAAQAAARPMIWLQGLAGACIAGVGVALISLVWPYLHGSVASAAPLLLAPLHNQLPLVVVVGVILVVAPLAFYLAVVRE